MRNITWNLDVKLKSRKQKNKFFAKKKHSKDISIIDKLHK
jgi:hypothetical protein